MCIVIIRDADFFFYFAMYFKTNMNRCERMMCVDERVMLLSKGDYSPEMVVN